jgi:hypothetical protein
MLLDPKYVKPFFSHKKKAILFPFMLFMHFFSLLKVHENINSHIGTKCLVFCECVLCVEIYITIYTTFEDDKLVSGYWKPT